MPSSLAVSASGTLPSTERIVLTPHEASSSSAARPSGSAPEMMLSLSSKTLWSPARSVGASGSSWIAPAGRFEGTAGKPHGQKDRGMTRFFDTREGVVGAGAQLAQTDEAQAAEHANEGKG